MHVSENPRSRLAKARKAALGGAMWFIGLFAMALFVPVPVQASPPPDGLTVRDWQAIRSQVPAAPLSWPADSSPVEQAKLMADDAQRNDQFGYSVAVSGDSVVVGAPGGNGGAGAAYVLVRSGTSWIQQAKLVASDAESSDEFGYSVAISGDIVVVGAWGESTGARNAGAAYVFVRSGTSWSEQAKLVAGIAWANAQFGRSVAVSGDTVLVGAFGEYSGIGAAYVFKRSGTVWNEQARLVAGGAGTVGFFGNSVAISGNTAVVGANVENAGSGATGAAYVFKRSGTSWNQQARLLADDGQPNDNFGFSVAVSGDTVVVGAYYEDTGDVDAGAAYVFERSGTSWSQQAKFVADDAEAGDQFGRSVSVSDDIAVVGAFFESTGGVDAGAAYVFERSGTSWSQQAKLMAGDAQAQDQFGASVAVSGDTVLVGAFYEDTRGNNAGAAYVYVPGYQVQVDVSGLTGTGLVLQNNGGDDLAIAADGLHAFARAIVDGSAYAVTVATQPGNPLQTCTVTNGTGIITGAPVTVGVTCAAVTYTVTAAANGNGTVTPGSQTVEHGDSATISIMPAAAHHVASVTGDTCTPADNGDDTWTAAAITADCAITATFAIDTYSVTATANGNGTITPTSVDVAHGDDAVFMVTPAAGWHLSTVTGSTCTPVDQGDGTWIAGPITEACHVQAWFSIGLHTVGGNVSGLDGTGLVLRLNGGHDLAIAADGPFTFATTVASGQSYVATIASQPSGESCSLANGSGTVGDADITELVVTCAPVSATPVLTIDDGRDYARYGRAVEYTVTLANTGDAPIESSDVTFVPSAGFDADFATLTCFAGTGSCLVDPADPLHYTATVPPGDSVTWLVAIPVHGTTAEPSVELVVTATDATPAVDTNTLVILRDGFDIPYGDGTQGVETIEGERAKAILEGDAVAHITVPDAKGAAALAGYAAPRTLLRIRTETRDVAIEHRDLHGTSLVRLIDRRHGENERTSAWCEAAPGSELALGSLALADERRVVLLEGAATPLTID